MVGVVSLSSAGLAQAGGTGCAPGRGIEAEKGVSQPRDQHVGKEDAVGRQGCWQSPKLTSDFCSAATCSLCAGLVSCTEQTATLDVASQRSGLRPATLPRKRHKQNQRQKPKHKGVCCHLMQCCSPAPSVPTDQWGLRRRCSRLTKQSAAAARSQRRYQMAALLRSLQRSCSKQPCWGRSEAGGSRSGC